MFKFRGEIMVSNEIKIRVAQNCHGFRTSYFTELVSSITFGSENCSSCVNYVRGICTKELFQEIREIIRVN